MKRVYLDYAAATPIEPEVATAMQTAMANFANPAAAYTSARLAKTELDTHRKTLAMFLGANSDEIILTSGATESNNLAILGTARLRQKGEIISSLSEHSSIREPLKQLEQEGFTIHWCPVDKNGRVDKAQFKKLLNINTILVSVSLANSEFGTIEDITGLVEMVGEFENEQDTRVFFHTDASAAAMVNNCSVSRLGVDLLTLSSAKLYGPNGIGLLYIRRGSTIQPQIFGGAQENGLRAGTENGFLLAGFARAIELVTQKRKQDEKHFKELYFKLANYFKEKNVVINGDSKHRLFSLLNVSFSNVNGEDLVAYLDSKGFEVSTGAACEVSNQAPSAALLALGRTKKEAQGSLRISFGRTTTSNDIAAFTKALDETLTILKAQQ